MSLLSEISNFSTRNPWFCIFGFFHVFAPGLGVDIASLTNQSLDAFLFVFNPTDRQPGAAEFGTATGPSKTDEHEAQKRGFEEKRKVRTRQGLKQGPSLHGRRGQLAYTCSKAGFYGLGLTSLQATFMFT